MRPAVPGVPGADGPLAALGGDAPFLVWIGPPDSTSDLEAALARLDPARQAVLRISNPLTAPLSLQRVMLQLAPDNGDEPTGTGGDEAGRLLHAVAVCAAGRPFLLVVVEQAETLTPAALALLQLLPGLRGPGIPTVQVAFHGTMAFHALLRGPRFRPIRDHAADPPPLPARRSSERRRRGALLGAASIAVALLLAATLFPSRGPFSVATVPAAPAVSGPAAGFASPPLTSAEAAAPPTPPAGVALPVPAAPPAPPLAAGEESAPAPPNTDPPPAPEAPPPAVPPPAAAAEDLPAARTRLFREFSAFIDARGLAGRLSRSEREALFEEYLARRYAATAPIGPNLGAPAAAATVPEPAPPPIAKPEVVLFFRAGRPGAEALANEDAVLLRHQTPDVNIRPAADGPTVPTVRYFRPGDRSFALAIALALPSTTLDWHVMDLSGAADSPARPTIEVWLPGPP